MDLLYKLFSVSEVEDLTKHMVQNDVRITSDIRGKHVLLTVSTTPDAPRLEFDDVEPPTTVPTISDRRKLYDVRSQIPSTVLVHNPASSNDRCSVNGTVLFTKDGVATVCKTCDSVATDHCMWTTTLMSSWGFDEMVQGCEPNVHVKIRADPDS